MCAGSYGVHVGTDRVCWCARTPRTRSPFLTASFAVKLTL
jgi:hypothetical protein